MLTLIYNSISELHTLGHVPGHPAERAINGISEARGVVDITRKLD